jgi:hypothetical protein
MGWQSPAAGDINRRAIKKGMVLSINEKRRLKAFNLNVESFCMTESVGE